SFFSSVRYNKESCLTRF
ncbi:hypothetical protein TNCT_432141, partial [Trichonephila clavata]